MGGCFMIAARIKALYFHHIAARLIFITPIFFNFTQSLNDHYFIIIYRTVKKFGTFNHIILRYKLA